MNSLIILIITISTQATLAASLLLKGNLDPREVTVPDGYSLWSDTEVRKKMDRPMRQEIMTSSSLFLEKRISQSDFILLLKSWSELGLNTQERMVLTDTLNKSDIPPAQKNHWLCRIEIERNCTKIKIFPLHLSPILQKYDWLIVDGQAFPRNLWNEISVPNEILTWTFLSARFETYTFRGNWEELKFKNPVLNDWVTGDCEKFIVNSQVQDIDISVLLDRNCMRSALIKPEPIPTFYEKNKSKIWIAAGLVLGAGTFNAFAGKKVVLEKPSFR